MSEAVDLLQAILGGGHSREETLAVLETALEREVDPLDYCAASLGIGQALAMERAAAFIGLAYYSTVPSGLAGAPEPMRLDMLAHIRAFKMRLFDRDVFFSAPGFFDLLRLRARLRAQPDVARRLCLVPEPALRDYLVRINAPALIVEARQRLARRWPYAAAQLDLTQPVRIGFAAALLTLVALVLAAPFFGQKPLLPLVLGLLVVPAALRISAIFNRRRKPQSPQRPNDAELPVYTVLIPLRDEAHMVPQLVSAMSALDYPALCIKRTKPVRYESGCQGGCAGPMLRRFPSDRGSFYQRA